MILLLLKLNSWSDRTFILPEKSDRTLIYLDMQITIHANWKQSNHVFKKTIKSRYIHISLIFFFNFGQIYFSNNDNRESLKTISINNSVLIFDED